MKIRTVSLKDAGQINEILDYYIKNTAINFSYQPPTLEETENAIIHKKEKYPYLVLEENRKIYGFAYLSPLKDKDAYDWCCETTIYLRHDSTGCGYGKKLYKALEDIAREMGIINLYACIGYTKVEDEYLNNTSSYFHEALGYSEIGYFRNSGYKFNKFYDMKWYEHIIGDYSKVKSVIKFEELDKNIVESIYQTYL